MEYLNFEVELKEGEAFRLPKEAMQQIKPGKWLVTIRPALKSGNGMPVRGHSAFLNSYCDKDEGLYDDFTR